MEKLFQKPRLGYSGMSLCHTWAFLMSRFNILSRGAMSFQLSEAEMTDLARDPEHGVFLGEGERDKVHWRHRTPAVLSLSRVLLMPLLSY